VTCSCAFALPMMATQAVHGEMTSASMSPTLPWSRLHLLPAHYRRLDLHLRASFHLESRCRYTSSYCAIMFGRDKGDRLITRLKPILHAKSGNEFAQRVTLMLQPWNADFSAFKEDYEYKYQPVQQPKYDPVAATICQVLKDICRDNVVFANAFVRVYDATAALPVWPRDISNPEHTVKFYTFTQKGLEFPMTVPVAILQALES
jgi:hypothetical protein